MEKKLRVVTYNRVSTTEEKQTNALKKQITENKLFVNANPEWELVEEYIDEGKSATTTQGRKEFQRMISDIEAGKIDIVLVKLLDRGWRNVLDWAKFEELIYAKHVKLFIRQLNKFHNPTDFNDWMSSQMQGILNDAFSRMLSIKINGAHKTRMESGRSVITNGRMWGYRQLKGQAALEVIEDEAILVRFVFDEYVKGAGFRDIAKKIRDMGRTTKTGNPEFSLSTLKRMIRNPLYKGTLVCGKRHKDFFIKKIIDIPEDDWYIYPNSDVVPAIVDEETWEKANEILESRRRTSRIDEKTHGVFHGRYPLSGKITCGLCGKTYMHTSYRTTIQDRWACKNYKDYGKTSCDNIMLNYDDLNNLLRESIYNFIKNKDFIIKNLMGILEKSLTETKSSHNVDSSVKRINELEQQKSNLLDIYSKNDITREEFLSKRDELNGKIKILEQSVTEADRENEGKRTRKDRLIEIEKELKGLKIKSSTLITDENLKNFISRVTVFPDGKLDIVLMGQIPITAQYEKQNAKRRTRSEIEAARQAGQK